MNIKTLYTIIAVVFFIAAIGNIMMIAATWSVSLLGSKISSIAGALINIFFGLIVLKIRKTSSSMGMDPKEFEEVFNQQMQGGQK